MLEEGTRSSTSPQSAENALSGLEGETCDGSRPSLDSPPTARHPGNSACLLEIKGNSWNLVDIGSDDPHLLPTAYSQSLHPEAELETKTICIQSVERRIQWEHEWQLWHEFMHKYSTFEDWLRRAESQAASTKSSLISYSLAKEELKKFEVLQVEVRNRLCDLELIDRQYWHVLHTPGLWGWDQLHGRIQTSNQRWEALNKYISCICRRLQHFVSLREDFERERGDINIWLAEMNLRLTEVEHFSGCNSADKVKQLQAFQQTVEQNAERLNGWLECGEGLIMRSEPFDAVEIEEEMQDLLQYCVRVFEGVGRLHTRLLSMRLVFEDDCFSEGLSGCTTLSDVWDDEGICDRNGSSEDRSCAGGGGSYLDSLALEWDPSVDVGGSSSHDDADSSYFSSTQGWHLREESLIRGWHLQEDSLLKEECHSLNSVRPLLDEKSLNLKNLKKEECCNSENHTQQTSGDFLPSKTTTASCFESFDPERISAWLGQAEPTVKCTQAPLDGFAPDLKSNHQCLPVQPSHNVAIKNCSQHSGQQEVNFFRTSSTATSSQRRRQPSLQCPLKQVQGHQSSADVSITIETSSEEVLPQRTRPTIALLLRVAFLVHFLLVILLAVISQFPASARDFTCHQANNFARSFHLMLHYVNGPPPT
ncbi:nesprin-2 [Erpetoichthys calabaricus]|uniref:nesprin-2 n=1 Tax=Erpetoichthys calabaricus TaxID=27687 RepID=UPI002233E53A|nr:nesprin-2 [Erpetoichthys calabaricus]